MLFVFKIIAIILGIVISVISYKYIDKVKKE